MTEEPIRASDVEKIDPDLTSEDVLRAKARRAVATRRTRREALRRAGVDNVGSDSLFDRLEAGRQTRDEERMLEFRARKAAEEAVAKRRRK